MEFIFWFITIIIIASVIFPLCICGIYYLVVFVFLKKAHDAHRRYETSSPVPYVITETNPPTIFSHQSTIPAFRNTAFDVELNNQHQLHHQSNMSIHNLHHQMHMDIHNAAVNSQTTHPTFHSETFSSPSHNDYSSDKNDTSTSFTSSDPI